MTAKIKLSDLEYGVLNPIGDDTSDDSFDRRRSTMINYLHKVIGDAYSVNTLEKYNKFTGIVVRREEVSSVVTESPVDKIKAAEKESLFGGFTKFFSSEDVKTVAGYRVYIPELECRPAPKNGNDPVISTYQLMLLDKNYIGDTGFFGTIKPLEIGQIVGVVFADVLTLQDPRIVEAGETLIIDWTGEGETAQEVFANGTPWTAGSENYPVPSSFPARTTQETIDYASNYDDDPEVPNKSQHAAILSGLHPDFTYHVKGFLYDAWKELGASIILNSGYRSAERQTKVYADWVAAGRTGPEPATPGRSYHNVGMAIDFNPTINGNTLTTASSREAWQNSGIIGVGEKNELYWGGFFSTNWDPIHFDFRKKVSIPNKNKHLREAMAAATPPNRFPIA